MAPENSVAYQYWENAVTLNQGKARPGAGKSYAGVSQGGGSKVVFKRVGVFRACLMSVTIQAAEGNAVKMFFEGALFAAKRKAGRHQSMPAGQFYVLILLGK